MKNIDSVGREVERSQEDVECGRNIPEDSSEVRAPFRPPAHRMMHAGRAKVKRPGPHDRHDE